LYQKIDVVSLLNPVIEKIDAKPPKLFVGISLTPASVKSYHPSFWIFPAVLDTGLNKAFDIAEDQLISWTNTPKKKFGLIKRRDKVMKPYDIRAANIWLHRYPYAGPKFVGPDPPVHLSNSDEIRVMDRTPSGDPDPRLPLLGLEALIENGLTLNIMKPSMNSKFTFTIAQ